METRSIEITLETAKRWYEQGGELKDMALGVFTLEEMGYELPKTFGGLIVILAQWGIKLREEQYEDKNPQIAAVKKLMLLRDFYNNNWKPVWDSWEIKYSIVCDYKVDSGEMQLVVDSLYNPNSSHSFLIFNKREYAEEFLNNFHELIEQAGDLI